MINSTNDLLLVAASLKLHSRMRRHKQYVTNEIEINCHRPKGWRLDWEANCRFVRNNSFCNFDLSSINYLEFAVCTVRIDEYPVYGVTGYIACTILLLFLSMFSFYMVAKWFILPNMITLYQFWPLNQYQFGVIAVSTLYVTSFLFQSTFACNPPKESFALFLTILNSKTLTMYGLGLALIAVNKNLYIPRIRFIVNSTLIVIGNIYVITLINYKTENDKRNPDERKDIKMGWHAAFLVMASLIYIFGNFYVSYKLSKKKKKAQEQKNTSIITAILVENRSQTIAEMESAINTENFVEDLVRDVLVTDSPALLEYSPFNANLRAFYVNIFGKRCIVLKIVISPIWIILTLLIPVIAENRPLNGWNKYLLSLNCCCLPILLFRYTRIELRITLHVVGFIMAFLLLIGTRARDPPNLYKLFSVIGLLASFKICHLLEMETATLIQQSLQFIVGWNIDAVAILGTSFFSWASEMILLFVLIQAENAGIAFGIVTGLTMYNTLGTLPSIIFHACFKETSTIFITKNNTTVYVFLFLLIGYTFISIITTNFELRRSHGIFLFMFILVFFLYILLSACESIHPYGSQHASTFLFGSTGHSKWA